MSETPRLRWDGGPIIVYNPQTQAPTTGTNPNPGPAPVDWGSGNIIDILSRDPNRSEGDKPISGTWPIYGGLPRLGAPAQPQNAIERSLSGLAELVTEYPIEVFNAYSDFMDRTPDANQEKIWFQQNPATWPVIKMNGAQKLEAAEELYGDVAIAKIGYTNWKKLDPDDLAQLRELQDQLRDDRAWLGTPAQTLNVVAGTSRALSRLALRLFNQYSGKKPLGLQWSVLYDAMDQVFRRGAYFDRSEWQDAIFEAANQANAEYWFARRSKIDELLNTLAMFANDLTEIQMSEQERIQTRREIDRQLDAIQRALDEFQQSADGRSGVDLVMDELGRQPKYVRAVASDYYRFTGKKLASADTSLPLHAKHLSFGGREMLWLAPFAGLLAIRSREVRVREAEGKR